MKKKEPLFITGREGTRFVLKSPLSNGSMKREGHVTYGIMIKKELCRCFLSSRLFLSCLT